MMDPSGLVGSGHLSCNQMHKPPFTPFPAQKLVWIMKSWVKWAFKMLDPGACDCEDGFASLLLKCFIIWLVLLRVGLQVPGYCRSWGSKYFCSTQFVLFAQRVQYSGQSWTALLLSFDLHRGLCSCTNKALLPTNWVFGRRAFDWFKLCASIQSL